MMLAHRICIDPTEAQRSYVARAAGTARPVWNWVLAEWQRQYFDGIKRGCKAHPPQFKKKGRCLDGFHVANDKFRLEGRHAVLPKIGRVALCESLRLEVKIMGATVQREAGHSFLSVQVDVPAASAERKRSGDGVVGVDLGINAAATLSTGEAVASPRALKGAVRRLRIRARRDLQRLATDAAGRFCSKTALPVASRTATSGTASGIGPYEGGEVTPVTDEYGRQDGSGQEAKGEHFCSPVR